MRGGQGLQCFIRFMFKSRLTGISNFNGIGVILVKS